MSFSLQNLVRENVKRLTPYSSARKEFTGSANIFLDANENSFGSPLETNYHRYPDPLQLRIKEKVAVLNAVEMDEIFVGNGSDEAIDLLFRIFCEPRRDNIVVCPPTYGMYKVSAEINDVEIRSANLNNDFDLDPCAIKNVIDANTKLIFICSPNNPTGNSMSRKTILDLSQVFKGIVVIDEAYIQFSREESFISKINDFKNIVVLQTFSKAWALAGLRIGLAFANSELIELFNKVKPPYNVSKIAQDEVLKALENRCQVEETTEKIISERRKLIDNLSSLEIITRIYPSDANFVLVKTIDALEIYRHLVRDKIVVRNRNNVEMCEGCLRLTIGTSYENDILLRSLRNYQQRNMTKRRKRKKLDK